jgi:regulator of CtrA degradation
LWHYAGVNDSTLQHAAFGGPTLATRVVDALYTEALLLADETRGYFDDAGAAERDTLPPKLRVEFACEALKGTTRLMQVVGWLLMRKAVHAGELPLGAGTADNRRLGEAPPLDPAVVARLPHTARRLLASGEDLYQRVRRIDEGLEPPAPVMAASPALSLLQRLERSL